MADYDAKKEIYGKIKTALESGKPARSIALSEVSWFFSCESRQNNSCAQEEQTMLSNLNLLTMKPCIYAANVSENDLANKVNSCS